MLRKVCISQEKFTIEYYCYTMSEAQLMIPSKPPIG